QAQQPLPLVKQHRDLVELVRGALLLNALNSHTVNLSITEARLLGQWDDVRLVRVVENLLDNAHRFGGETSRIDVGLWREDDERGPWAVLSVRDYGVGIPSADLVRIFEPFARGDNVGSLDRGAGLGLWSTRQIVEQHGGSIAVHSREGEGSNFVV